MPTNERISPFTAWFAGPKSENGEAVARTMRRILEDHQYWRRNYYPEDGVVITSDMRHQNSQWKDQFEDRLFELLAALKADFPFHSPRYAAHMLAEQTIPSIAGYFAGMLYNPNNVTQEAAPVTVRLEREAGRMLAEMLGYDGRTSWAHLTGGGTVANLEALWVARTVAYLPLALFDVLKRLDLAHPFTDVPRDRLPHLPPSEALDLLQTTFDAAVGRWGEGPDTTARVLDAYRSSPYNVREAGLARIAAALGSEPAVVVPASHHYCLPKIMDVLGLGRNALASVPVDARFRMDVAALRATLDELERAGRHVLAVVAVVGTTEEGAVDPVHEIAALRAEREREGRPSFWLHADAAYGGYLRTTLLPERLGLGAPVTTVRVRDAEHQLALDLPDHETCDALERLGACDSIVVDPHKLGYVPYPAGAVCFRSNLVRPLLRQRAPYLEDASSPWEDPESDNIGVYILEGSKPGASAASVWLSHTTIPLDTSGHGRLVRETIRNACELAALLRAWPDLDDAHGMRAVVLCPPESNIVCYAFRPAGDTLPLDRLNLLNQTLYRRFSLPEHPRVHVYDQKFFVSRTVLTADQYAPATVGAFLERLGARPDGYGQDGVFLLRSTLMNPWYGIAKRHGRHYLAGLVQELYAEAGRVWADMRPARGNGSG